MSAYEYRAVLPGQHTAIRSAASGSCVKLGIAVTPIQVTVNLCTFHPDCSQFVTVLHTFVRRCGVLHLLLSLRGGFLRLTLFFRLACRFGSGLFLCRLLSGRSFCCCLCLRRGLPGSFLLLAGHRPGVHTPAHRPPQYWQTAPQRTPADSATFWNEVKLVS